MLISYDNPVGIDAVIDRVQRQLHRDLSTALPVDVMDNYLCTPRAYANKSQDNGYTAEMYIGANEYKEVYYDDTKTMVSFFGIGPVVKFDLKEKASIHLVVFADLDRVYPDLPGRHDERLRREFINALDLFNNGLTYEGFEMRIENVLKEYPGSRRDQRLKFIDMQPRHCFRINFTAMYSIINFC